MRHALEAPPERTPQEQEAIVCVFVDMVCTYMERYATPAGMAGISAQELVRALAEQDVSER